MTRKDLQARQYVRISGLGTPQFNQAIQGLKQLRGVMEVRTGQGTLSQVRVSTERGFNVLEFGSRFFSSQREATSHNAVELGQIIDPMGVLRRLGEQHGGVHLPDNTVEYYERTVTRKENKE